MSSNTTTTSMSLPAICSPRATEPYSSTLHTPSVVMASAAWRASSRLGAAGSVETTTGSRLRPLRRDRMATRSASGRHRRARRCAPDPLGAAATGLGSGSGPAVRLGPAVCRGDWAGVRVGSGCASRTRWARRRLGWGPGRARRCVSDPLGAAATGLGSGSGPAVRLGPAGRGGDWAGVRVGSGSGPAVRLGPAGRRGDWAGVRVGSGGASRTRWARRRSGWGPGRARRCVSDPLGAAAIGLGSGSGSAVCLGPAGRGGDWAGVRVGLGGVSRTRWARRRLGWGPGRARRCAADPLGAAATGLGSGSGPTVRPGPAAGGGRRCGARCGVDRGCGTSPERAMIDLWNALFSTFGTRYHRSLERAMLHLWNAQLISGTRNRSLERPS